MLLVIFNVVVPHIRGLVGLGATPGAVTVDARGEAFLAFAANTG